MINCPSCGASNEETSKYCTECGAALRPEFAATITHGTKAVANDSSTSASGSSHHGRFLPGTKVADRYRIVSLVGKGGMGEVYRADDLKLGHPVALKFLPKDLADDRERLEYFHTEVRLTRQISHPNVCRVYDIGEVDGQHFLSMEYIDGEDLKALLRRIGRLPKDKGVEIAQQLCAGLSAAHDKGVLHRDLKPANIMIDGRGQVRITDFGLARVIEDGGEGEVAGTPAYMAPEQLTRGEATIQSDLYSLGLIFYELFTGKAVHTTGSLPELLKAHQESSPSQPSSLVEDMDLTVERVILRCLEKESRERPKSAHAVAAALPGGDPLAAALAAGETPSPDMVAAAGETGTLPLRTGVFCLAAVLVALVALMFLSPLVQPTAGPQTLDPLRLRIATQDRLLAPLGHYDNNAKPKDAVHGLQLNAVHDWEFWYRQWSDDYLTPTIPEITNGPKSYAISMSNPSPFDAGMVSVRTDLQGKLIELLAVPNGASSTRTDNPFDIPFARAGLSFLKFKKIDQAEERPANWKPPVHCDDAAVYRPKSGDSPVRVIVALDSGRLVYFYAGQPKEGRFADRQFSSPGESSNNGNRQFSYHHLLQLVVLLASIFLTLRNVRLGRADRRGALRFAIWLGGIQLLVWLFGLHHVVDPLREWHLLRDYLRVPWLAYFFRHWLYYMALEPYIRRYWPNVLIAWSRAVDGRLRDPLLGQRLLIGCLTGVLVWLIASVASAVAVNLSSDTMPLAIRFDVGSPLRLTATLLFQLSHCASNGVFALMLLFLLRALLRDTRLAVAGYALLVTAVFALDGLPPVALMVIPIWCLGLGLAITRFGLIAGIAFIFAQQLLETFPITPHITSWYGGGTLVAFGGILVVTVYGFYTSTLARHSLSGGGRLDKTRTVP